MRKPIIAGNWKMNTIPEQATDLVNSIKALLPEVFEDGSCEVVVCPPAICLQAAFEAAKGSSVMVGGQNVHFKEKGAFTGEVSADMLKSVGCTYVIIGHSERRQYFGETDKTVNLRTLAAVRAGLTPIVCVGELESERELGYTDVLVSYQTKTALTGLTADEVAKIVIAYEPVWAIGTGKTATPEEAGRVCGIVRKAVAEQFGAEVAEAVRVQYGGSMNAGNAASLMAQPDIDGGLIGGASLVANDFITVIKAAVK